MATASYEARAFGIGSAMSCGGGTAPLPAGGVRAAGPRALPRAIAGGLGARRPASARASSRSGSTRATSISRRWSATRRRARCSARSRLPCAEATGLGCSLGAGGSKTVAKIASDRRQARRHRRRRAGRGGGLPRTAAAPAAARRRTEGGRAAPRGRAASASAISPGSTRPPWRVHARRERRARSSSAVRAAIDPIGPVVTEPQEPVTICVRGDLRAATSSIPTACRRRARAARRARVEPARALRLSRAHRHGKLRYPDFALVTRARTLDGAVEARPTCAALVRAARAGALDDRPAPVRLLGVGTGKLARDPELQLRLPLGS